MLRPKWSNWYLALFYVMGYGSLICLLSAFMMWYVNVPRPYIDKVILLGFSWILFCLAIYVSIEIFEFIWKRVCK